MFLIDIPVFLSKHVMNFIKENTTKNGEELEIIQYGIEVFFINLFKITFLFLVAWGLGVAKYLAVLFVSYGCIRIFAAGVHAPSSLICTIMNFIFFLGGTYLCLWVPQVSQELRMILYIITFVLLLKYAPADTEDRPLTSATHRKKLKIQSIIALCLIFLSTLFVKSEIYLNLITCGALLGGIVTTPVIYFILGKGYKNYEKVNEQIYGDEY